MAQTCSTAGTASIHSSRASGAGSRRAANAGIRNPTGSRCRRSEAYASASTRHGKSAIAARRLSGIGTWASVRPTGAIVLTKNRKGRSPAGVCATPWTQRRASVLIDSNA